MVRDLLKEVLIEETLRAEQTVSLSESFSKMLREEMKKQCVTQEELAARLGTTQGYVPYLLNSKSNLSLKTISRVLTALDMRLIFSFEGIGVEDA